ncbi:Rpn family recombination-promoting nuclease/putative transposase [Candidatus Enterococcus murrayae]|uniref:Rpn family recombination-promoting nuclease/putative transposase n=1 Tax=Candidatus Enterococcus murrayae TaxID=2815321 RepID=A0ABS3HN96_9ENTE|nr:Rpn family recombination-promoting nuclease/putative transposase [Enterococcus sp. MJM16]MBO0454472.1 Rpn family recombination-promoting nuclease/putative transposase [Enterococcus sp. MJM16]
MQKFLPTNDLLFKKFLTSEDSQHILKAFVKDLLGIEFKSLKPKQTYHIDSYIENYEKQQKEAKKEKKVLYTEVDVLAEADDGSRTTIECQVQNQDYFNARALFYLTEAYRAPFGRKPNSKEKESNYSSLYPAYGINIVDFYPASKDANALQRYHLLEEQSYTPFVNDEGKELLILCFLSLRNKNIDRTSAAYHWQFFLKEGEVLENAPEYIKEAKQKVDYHNLERSEQTMIMKMEKAEATFKAIVWRSGKRWKKESREV